MWLVYTVHQFEKPGLKLLHIDCMFIIYPERGIFIRMVAVLHICIYNTQVGSGLLISVPYVL